MIRPFASYGALSIVLTLFSSVVLCAQTDNDYGRISRSMETFGAAFREIATEYIDETDPELIIAAGIRGMLSELDPYSTFMKSSDEDDINDLATSQYVGFGFSIARRNGLLTISDVRTGFPAALAGVRPGDRLVQIDGTVTDTMQADGLRPLTRGLVGSRSEFQFVREGLSDTIRVSLTRTAIPIECVSLATRLSGDIGYIELSRFARSAGKDVRNALVELSQKSELKGIILDLRGNPGGLLDAAVSVSEIFLPRGTLIVSTLDRYDNRKEYFSAINEMPTQLPLVVLVDEHSASASEIVAAAIQDNDRGMVIGRPSFGKGLVQTLVGLPYDASMKLTTARYYAPSGRCLQKRVRVDPRQDENQVFVTKAGRTVTATSGVTPDSVVSDSTFPELVALLNRNHIISLFATQWAAPQTALPAGFKVGSPLLEAFMSFAISQKPADRSVLLASLYSARKSTDNVGASEGTRKALDAAIKAAERDYERSIRANSGLITTLLDAEIRSRFDTDDARARVALTLDPAVRTAINLFTSGKFTTFFGGWSEEDQ